MSPASEVTATPAEGPGGAPGYVINGVKTWCTFGARADALALLARTDPDKSAGHRGLSLFIVPKERGDGHGFVLTRIPSVTASARWRVVRSTRSATGACTPTRSRSTTGGSRREPRRRDRRHGQGLLSADGRLRERTAADRRPSDRCDGRPPTTPQSSTPRTGGCSARTSLSTSSPRPSSAGWR